MIASIPDILAKQRAYFQQKHTLSISDRLAHLKKIETYLKKHQEELVNALAKDLNKPPLEAFLSEYYFLIQELKIVQKSLESWMKPMKVKSPIYFQPCKSEVVLEPFGMTLIIAPWNYPIQLAISPLVAAIAAGNTVVLKPSEISSASERFLEQLVKSCFAEEYVAVITGGVEVATALLEQRFDFIFYTGSTHVGRLVAERAAKYLTPTILELGGKCPCVIDQSADIEIAARRVLSGKFFNGGQTCFAPDFVAIHEDKKADFIRACENLFQEVPWADNMASIINIKHLERLQSLLGDHSILQQSEDDPSRCFMAPRILTDAKWSDEVMKEEIFGPVLPIVTFSDQSELITRLRQYESPLAFYIFSEDESWQVTMMESIRSGGVCINDTMKQGSNLDLPFGGVGDSGYGRYRGKEGVLAMSYKRAVVKRSNRAPKSMDILPPYEKSYQWMKKFMS